jgi:asparagine synthase (glutamine-hydrolysing)
MVHAPTGLAVCYNGEIYNHVELRCELEQLGHVFSSHSDTEVLLHAWLEWGAKCLSKLNGMFAFLLLDPRGGGTLHAVRDRFGVKPLYHARVGGVLVFASEIKQIRTLPGFIPRLNRQIAADYLAFGLLDHSEETFDEGITQLRGGERCIVQLDDPGLRVKTERWYDLRPRPFHGSMADAATEMQALLSESVSLRLRADVPVGSCLSGGLDSSAIVCLAHRLLSATNGGVGQITVTACYEEPRFDEWQFAQQVVRQSGVKAVRVWPSVERLQSELDLQMWHLDEPAGSTSQFSQWCVFAGAASASLKVMLDGQGSDEQLAGYGGSDAPLYAGLLRHGSIAALASELVSFRQRHGLFPLAQILQAGRSVAPAIDALLPNRFKVRKSSPDWLTPIHAVRPEPVSIGDLGTHLRQQLLETSLPALLRYEDRNSMAWSVESRVPFLDYRLVEFLAGVPDQMKLHRGMTKVVFRDAMRGILPESVRSRTDKMGFVTPEELWLTRSATDWFRAGVEIALNAAPDLFDRRQVLVLLDKTIRGMVPFTFVPWRILCFGRWLTGVASGSERPIAVEHATQH